MFSLQQQAASSTLEPFQFEGPDGEECQLPHMRKLPLRLAIAANTGDYQTLLSDLSDLLPFDIYGVDPEGIEALMQAWKTHSELDGDAEGKSLNSSPSSRRTARSSRSTSGGSSKSGTRKR